MGVAIGYNTYKKQIENKIDLKKKNIIVFPNYIEKVAISFVQGMFKDILSKINKEEFEKYIEIEASTEELKNKIIYNAKF